MNAPAPPTSPSAARAATRVTAVTTLFLVVGVTLGLTLDANAHVPAPWNRVSSLLGWVYFACWSASFYPQVLLNHARKSVHGLSMDYVVLGLLGFVCYTIFNCAFYYSEHVQALYMARHGGHRNAVEINDVLFGIHASVLTAVSLAQSFVYKSRGDQPQAHRVSRATVGWTAATLGIAALFGIAIMVSGPSDSGAALGKSSHNGSRIGGGDDKGAAAVTDASVSPADADADNALVTPLDFLYYLSFVKLVLTLVKYIPQVVLNCRLQSTVGWAIGNVYLDIAGGVFSIAQQVLDSAATSDWSAITGDPVKFALAIVTMSMDAVLLLQHYVLYPASSLASMRIDARREKQLLLP